MTGQLLLFGFICRFLSKQRVTSRCYPILETSLIRGFTLSSRTSSACICLGTARAVSVSQTAPTYPGPHSSRAATPPSLSSQRQMPNTAYAGHQQHGVAGKRRAFGGNLKYI